MPVLVENSNDAHSIARHRLVVNHLGMRYNVHTKRWRALTKSP